MYIKKCFLKITPLTDDFTDNLKKCTTLVKIKYNVMENGGCVSKLAKTLSPKLEKEIAD